MSHTIKQCYSEVLIDTTGRIDLQAESIHSFKYFSSFQSNHTACIVCVIALPFFRTVPAYMHWDKGEGMDINGH